MGGGGRWQPSNLLTLMEGQGPHLTEKNKNSDPTRAPPLEGFKLRPEPPPPLHCYCHLESRAAHPGNRGREGGCRASPHRGSSSPGTPPSPTGPGEAEAAGLS